MLDSLSMLLSPTSNFKSLLTISSRYSAFVVKLLKITAENFGRPNFSDQDIQRLRNSLGEERFESVKHLLESPRTTFYGFFGEQEVRPDNLSILDQLDSLSYIIEDLAKLYEDYNGPVPSTPLRQLVEQTLNAAD